MFGIVIINVFDKSVKTGKTFVVRATSPGRCDFLRRYIASALNWPKYLLKY